VWRLGKVTGKPKPKPKKPKQKPKPKRPGDVTIDGTYTPIPGNFNGDDRSDVIWYGPGGAGDSIWFGLDGLGKFAFLRLAARGQRQLRPFIGRRHVQLRQRLDPDPAETGDRLSVRLLDRTRV